jgi:leucyl/phenylalanyl-tRNA--protein transferase
VVPWLSPGDPFPPVERALREPNGLLAAGTELTSERLIEAYSRGIFPWFNEEDPVLWWSPDPRMVLFTNELRVSRSLRKVIRSGTFSVTFDTAFEDVMRGCAEPRAGQDGTWISDVMLEAYTAMAEAGLAHSVEVWSGRALVGGVYGVAVGRMFFGESMFSRVSNASKVGLTMLVWQLERWGFEVIDCQMATSHLASLGAREISRSAFVALVERLSVQAAVLPPWRLDADLPGRA